MTLALVLFSILIASFFLLIVFACIMFRLEDKDNKGKGYRIVKGIVEFIIVVGFINLWCTIGAFIYGFSQEKPVLTRAERQQIFGVKKVCRTCNRVFLCLEHDENNIVEEWGGLVRTYVCDDCVGMARK